MSFLNEVPTGERIHIGIFGRTNAGKSSLVNVLTNQDVSIVSDVPGTTTDPVNKNMEINPIGPCTIIDTPGLDDKSILGNARKDRTEAAVEKTDIAIVVGSATTEDVFAEESMEHDLIKLFVDKDIPTICVINKIDLLKDDEKKNELSKRVLALTRKLPLLFSCTSCSHETKEELKEMLIKAIPESFGNRYITNELVEEGDTVLLIMPQDIQAPKGRLILPQVQTIRELLDRKCIIISATTDKMVESLDKLKEPPKLIITDSQAFDFVYKNKPEKSLLTSFSVLFAAYKGDIDYYVKSAKAIGMLNNSSKVLIAECCTHAPLSEDIGREKIPAMLRKMAGEGISIDIVSGADFPKDLSPYDLVIQCGGCMFNRRFLLSRIQKAKEKNIPMTNYGIAIAFITGILEKIEY